MKKRKARNKIKDEVDLTVPISIELFGSDQDPCFGKLFDPRASECQRCGDSEICAIVMGQKNHTLRLQQEKQASFKDLEELEIPKLDKVILRKQLKRRIREVIKEAGGKPLEMDYVVNTIFDIFMKDGVTKIRIRSLIKKLSETSNHIILKENKLKWK